MVLLTLKWRPENSVLLRSLGWNQPNFYGVGEPFMGVNMGPESFKLKDDDIFPYHDYTGLERFYLNKDGTISLDNYMGRGSFPLNDDDIIFFDNYIGLENFHLIGGDIVPRVDDRKDKSPHSIKDELWPHGIVPYTISLNSSGKAKAIQGAMKYIENVTCIRFVPRAEENNYIRINDGQGCSSVVGMTGGAQNVTLGPSCYRLGLILHELLHVLGFYHEQSRSDRDEYINILWDNIRKGHEKNFKKMTPDIEPLLTPYDYDSIMQYDEYSFSKNRTMGLKTMTAKKKGVVLRNPGDKVLSKSDIKRIFILYNC